MSKHRYERLAALGLVAVLAGCSNNSAPVTVTPTPTPAPAPAPAPVVVLAGLARTTIIGSTIDVGTGAGAGDFNPYGLAIAPVTTGGVTAGDLIVSNFNSMSTQGAGTTIEDLKPVAGSTPVRIAQDASLAGSNSLAFNPGGPLWIAAYTANDNPIYTVPTGAASYSLASALVDKKYIQGPWGEVFGSPTSAAGYTTTAPAAFYISNAYDGSIVKIDVTTAFPFTRTKIITGFPYSLDKNGNVFAPAGLTYDAASDTLYVVSTNSNGIVAFSGVSTIPEGGVVVTVAGVAATAPYTSVAASAYTFTGPAAVSSKAHVVFSGSPLNVPVSSALLYNGNLVVGNTGDNNLVEIQPATGTGLGTVQAKVEVALDPMTGKSSLAGAIFGIATSGTTLATQKIYFNNDNENNVVSLSQ